MFIGRVVQYTIGYVSKLFCLGENKHIDSCEASYWE